MTEKILLAWSGGKDSALALHEIQKDDRYHVAAILTTVTGEYDRISMHGVRRPLLLQQAESLGYPLVEVAISAHTTNAQYDAAMREVLEKYKSEGAWAVAFGDIFLEEVRKYREDNLAKIGMRGLFPLWEKNTTELAQTFIMTGYEAVITCIDSTALRKELVGRAFDQAFLGDLPSSVDPCGENGEFHSFVYDGPIFGKRISFKRGDIVLRENRFYYCDLLPL